MAFSLFDLAFLASGFALGGALMLWAKSRKVTTKAEAMKLLAAEAALVAKMPGAAEGMELVNQQVAAETMAAQQLAAAIAKAANVPARP